MNALNSMPLKIKIIIFLCYITPLMLDTPNGFLEVFWALTVVPPLFFAWYYGFKGGIVAAISAALLQSFWEASQYIFRTTDYAI